MIIQIRNILLVLLVFSTLTLIGQEEWELKKEQDGIRIYTTYIEGSDIKAFRAEAVMEGKLSAFVAVLKDVDAYGELFSTTKFIERLEETDTTLLHYSQTSVPWPIKDRDGVYATRFTQHYGTKVVTAEVYSVEGVRPENEDFERIIKAKGFWKFFPVDHNKVEVIFQMQADPGGNLPAWLINMFLVDSPFKDMKNMQDRVRLTQYENKKFEFLVDY